MNNSSKNIRRNDLIQLLFGIAIIILVNIIGSFIFTRIDLTSEKRYTLSDATKNLLRELDDYVYVKIYLEGEFPAGFKRLRNETREMLDEFRAYSDFIDYGFINPSESDDAKERNDTYQLLVERGLNPTDLQVRTNEGMQNKIIFPGALITYKDKELPLELLRTQMGVPPEAVLNNSIQALEFNLANTIRKLSQTKKPGVVFIQGHGELAPLEVADIAGTLMEDYQVDMVRIDGQLNSLSERVVHDSSHTMIKNKYDAIIIAKPDSLFSEQDKFIIDQFIMRGGKVLWLIDPIFASMDSIQHQESTIGVALNLNLEDQLFKYGIRLNTDLIMDLNALPIPLTVGQIGDQPQIEYFPWFYFPLLTPLSVHPVTNNLNAIKTEFLSSIDTLPTPGISKKVLLETSPYSRVVKSPVFITLSVLRDKPDEALYHDPPQQVAVLLEGNFPSVFSNRIPPRIAHDKDIGFLKESVPNKMIIMSDGDVIKNQFHIPNGYPLPLGYDQFTGQTFGNKEFILNALNYLVDDSGLISIRSRELKLRLLDKARAANNKFMIQALNVALPVLLIILLGLIMDYLRKRKYKSNWS